MRLLVASGCWLCSVVGNDDCALSFLQHEESISSGAELKDDFTSVVMSFLNSLQELKYGGSVLVMELDLP